MTDIPDYDDLPRRGGVASSWGLWGNRDVLGCLNLLSPARVLAAAREIERGATFPLGLSLRLPDPPLFGRSRYRHTVVRSPDSTSQDDVLEGFNTQSSSQWDGFRHVRREGHGHYGGVPDEEHGVHHWAMRGIVSRGVLADVSRWRVSVGRPIRHGSPDPIEPADIVATLAAQGTTVEPGDILLIRTGWLAWYLSLDPPDQAVMADPERLVSPGLRPVEATARMLWDLHVAAVSADNPALEVWPIGALLEPADWFAIRADPAREHEVQLHTRLQPMLGLPIGELWDLEALADDCHADRRYSCFLGSVPLAIPGGVGSPANAIAIK